MITQTASNIQMDPALAYQFMTGGQMGYMPQAQYLTPAEYGIFRTVPGSDVSNGRLTQGTAGIFTNMNESSRGSLGGLLPEYTINTYKPWLDPRLQQEYARRRSSDWLYGMQTTLPFSALNFAAGMAVGFNPVGLAATFLAPNPGEWAEERRRTSREIQNISTAKIFTGGDTDRALGFGFNYRTARSIDKYLRDMAADDTLFKEGDLRDILKLGMENGIFDYATTGDQYKRSLKTIRDSMSTMMEVLGTQDFRDIMKDLKRMQSMGANMNEYKTIARQEQSLARILGMSHDAMTETFGKMGAMMFQQQGLSAIEGSLQSERNAASIAMMQRMGLVTPQQLARYGGISGMAQRMTQQDAVGLDNIKDFIMPALMNSSMTGFAENMDISKLNTARGWQEMAGGAYKIDSVGKFMNYNVYSKDAYDRLLKEVGSDNLIMMMAGGIGRSMGQKGQYAHLAGLQLMGYTPETAFTKVQAYFSPAAQEQQQRTREAAIQKEREERALRYSPINKLGRAISSLAQSIKEGFTDSLDRSPLTKSDDVKAAEHQPFNLNGSSTTPELDPKNQTYLTYNGNLNTDIGPFSLQTKTLNHEEAMEYKSKTDLIRKAEAGEKGMDDIATFSAGGVGYYSTTHPNLINGSDGFFEQEGSKWRGDFLKNLKSSLSLDVKYGDEFKQFDVLTDEGLKKYQKELEAAQNRWNQYGFYTRPENKQFDKERDRALLLASGQAWAATAKAGGSDFEDAAINASRRFSMHKLRKLVNMNPYFNTMFSHNGFARLLTDMSYPFKASTMDAMINEAAKDLTPEQLGQLLNSRSGTEEFARKLLNAISSNKAAHNAPGRFNLNAEGGRERLNMVTSLFDVDRSRVPMDRLMSDLPEGLEGDLTAAVYQGAQEARERGQMLLKLRVPDTKSNGYCLGKNDCSITVHSMLRTFLKNLPDRGGLPLSKELFDSKGRLKMGLSGELIKRFSDATGVFAEFSSRDHMQDFVNAIKPGTLIGMKFTDPSKHNYGALGYGHIALSFTDVDGKVKIIDNNSGSGVTIRTPEEFFNAYKGDDDFISYGVTTVLPGNGLGRGFNAERNRLIQEQLNRLNKTPEQLAKEEENTRQGLDIADKLSKISFGDGGLLHSDRMLSANDLQRNFTIIRHMKEEGADAALRDQGRERNLADISMAFSQALDDTEYDSDALKMEDLINASNRQDVKAKDKEDFLFMEGNYDAMVDTLLQKAYGAKHNGERLSEDKLQEAKKRVFTGRNELIVKDALKEFLLREKGVKHVDEMQADLEKAEKAIITSANSTINSERAQFLGSLHESGFHFRVKDASGRDLPAEAMNEVLSSPFWQNYKDYVYAWTRLTGGEYQNKTTSQKGVSVARAMENFPEAIEKIGTYKRLSGIVGDTTHYSDSIRKKARAEMDRIKEEVTKYYSGFDKNFDINRIAANKDSDIGTELLKTMGVSEVTSDMTKVIEGAEKSLHQRFEGSEDYAGAWREIENAQHESTREYYGNRQIDILTGYSGSMSDLNVRDPNMNSVAERARIGDLVFALGGVKLGLDDFSKENYTKYEGGLKDFINRQLTELDNLYQTGLGKYIKSNLEKGNFDALTAQNLIRTNYPIRSLLTGRGEKNTPGGMATPPTKEEQTRAAITGLAAGEGSPNIPNQSQTGPGANPGDNQVFTQLGSVTQKLDGTLGSLTVAIKQLTQVMQDKYGLKNSAAATI